MTPLSRICRVDVRGTELADRRSNALLAYRRLLVGDQMEVVDGKDPTDLFSALQDLAPSDFSWLYQERGPDVWRVSVQKLGKIYSAGECCGVCGGASPSSANRVRSNP
jgi:uncharacterized protein (DUF2249 family)